MITKTYRGHDICRWNGKWLIRSHSEPLPNELSCDSLEEARAAIDEQLDGEG